MIIQLNEDNKTYTEKDMSNQPTNDKNTYTVTKIGDETVNGYKCIHSVITNSRGENTDMWTSKDVLFYDEYNKMAQSNPRIGSSAREKAMKDAGVDGFPVKMVTKNKEGDFTMECFPHRLQ